MARQLQGFATMNSFEAHSECDLGLLRLSYSGMPHFSETLARQLRDVAVMDASEAPWKCDLALRILGSSWTSQISDTKTHQLQARLRCGECFRFSESGI